MEELWKDIPGYEGEYQASNLGRIKSLNRYVRCGHKGRGKRLVKERFLRPGSYCQGGHLSVILRRGTIGKPVHQLVMLAFVGKRPEGLEVCHNDGDPTNNALNNLRYDSRTNNILDVLKSGKRWRALNTAEAKEIKDRLAEGARGVDLAKEFKVSQGTISAIKKGRTFKWLA